MKLPIKQVLQKGMSAHKDGNLKDAERLYRAILKDQPLHPEANHNLGVLSLSVNKTNKALTLFKTALEANPKKEQFWLSYIDALIKERQFDSARQMVKQAKKQGFAQGGINVREVQLSSTYKQEDANRDSPSQNQLSNLLAHYQAGGLADAEKLAISITREFPKHQFAWKILGAVFGQTGRESEAVNANETAVALYPKDAEAHSNLGNTLNALNRLEEAETSLRKAIELQSDFAEAHSNLGNTLNALGRLDEAEMFLRKAITWKPDYVEAYCNLGNTLHGLGRLDEAEESYTKAIALRPDFATAHSNLGNTLESLGRSNEAEASHKQAILLKPNYAEAHNNLGITLKALGRLNEAEISLKQAITLKPDYAEAHNNLGITLKELGRLDEAIVSHRQALVCKPDYAKAFNNLGATLQELGRLEEAETSLRKAIALMPDFAAAHFNLGKVLQIGGDEDSALGSVEKAYSIDSKSKPTRLLLSYIKSRQRTEESEDFNYCSIKKAALKRLISSPLILKRAVEAELIFSLYEMSSREMNKTADARYGNGKCSLDFSLFTDSRSIIKTLSDDLTRIMKEAVKSDIYIYDSFFNILNAGGGTTPHNHLNELDKETGLDLGKQKYSLVYYLCVGDQNCSEPGFLKLYDPAEEILPTEGMITIIPASRKHSAIYGGKTDRVMIGVNFYGF